MCLFILAEREIMGNKWEIMGKIIRTIMGRITERIMKNNRKGNRKSNRAPTAEVNP